MTLPTPSGFIPHIGITIESRSDGKSICTLEVADHHRNPNGVVHGGVPYALADTGMAVAVMSTLPPGDGAVTVEISMVYTAPIKAGTIRCETEVINQTKRLATVESRLTCGDVLVGKALGTFAVLRSMRPPAAVE